MTEYERILKDSKNPLDQLLYKKFITNVMQGYIEVTSQKYCLPENYLKFKDEIDDYKVEPGDFLVVSHPKTGTTWVHELLWLLQNNFDYNQATEQCPRKRVPYLDHCLVSTEQSSVKNASLLPRPRVLKTHLPWELLPKSIRDASPEELNAPDGFKIVYVYRNAKDVCTSEFHFLSKLGFTGSLEDFVKLFIAGRIPYGPYFKHIESCFKHKHYKNILFVNYEDMKRDLKSIIRQVAEFVGKTIGEVEVEKLDRFLQFDNMKNLRKNDEFEFAFYRSGTVGNFKADLTEDMNVELNKWIKTELIETKLDLPNLLVE